MATTPQARSVAHSDDKHMSIAAVFIGLCEDIRPLAQQLVGEGLEGAAQEHHASGQEPPAHYGKIELGKFGHWAPSRGCPGGPQPAKR